VSSKNLLDGFWTESELATQVRRSARTVARWRGLRTGPPFTYLGKEIIYSKDSARAWLKANERPMPREGRRQKSGT
jgi:hypothetical protein